MTAMIPVMEHKPYTRKGDQKFKYIWTLQEYILMVLRELIDCIAVQ